ncbi:MAG TPA: three-Cys-motif partner protein TcmP [Thermoanaerobaculia bacterium]
MRFDQIGYWSQVKLDIVRDYAKAYSTILAKQPFMQHVYVDAFAGAGVHKLKASGELVPGSPLNALAVDPPFREVHLIDLDGAKIANLRSLVGNRPDVFIHEGDCNAILLNEVFPRAKYEDYRRALCLLDPYGLTLDWAVVEKAGQMGTVEIFLNFPMMDMNRNALWTNPAGVDPAGLERMTAFWGDDSWREVAYAQQGNLFGASDLLKKAGNDEIVEAYRRRLREVAGFQEVPRPIPMRNSIGAVVYYLFFASSNSTGAKIARHIFNRYEKYP